MPPVVGRITRLDSAAALAKVAVGHMLVSINGVDTARQGYDHVVGMLQKISRPATLRFRVPRALAPPGLSSLSSGSSMPGLPVAPGFRHQRSDPRNSAMSSVSDPGHHRSSSREQYTVVWTEGPLGMILQPDKDDCHVPCIRKITGKGVGTGMERATVGDILVAVNGQETKSLGFRSTISLLKTIRKPAVLKFKRMRRTMSRTPSYREPSDAGSTRSIPTTFSNDLSVYDIVWREGDLGLKLKPGRHDVPVLSKLTGKGNASGLQFASIGDELVSVNGSPVEGEAYQDTLRMLKHSPKPAVLRFRRVRPRQSTDSIRSDPGFSRDLDSARKPHVPVYAGATRQREPEPLRKKKKKIPLDVAKELVAASLGVDGNTALFAGVPIHLIQEGTPEAHLLRKEAKICLTGGDRPQTGDRMNGGDRDRSGLAAKESLLRAEQEARVLQEALEKVKSQAKKYEEILGTQKRELLLAPAIRNKSEEVVGRQNNMIAELSTVISGFRRESYTELEVVPVTLDDKDHQLLMDDLESVMNIPVVVPAAKYCADCGASDTESKLDKDEDGQYYCKDCWENFLNTGASNAPVEEIAPAPAPAPAPARPVSPTPSPALQLPEPEAPPRSLTRMKSENKALEEQNARLEAEKKLMELKELRHSGTIPSMERQPSMTAVDRNKRDRRGLEEFARALREEEERARADGNVILAKKLSAQISRIEADAGLSPTSSAPTESASSPLSTMGDVAAAAESEFGQLHRSGSSPQGIVRSTSATSATSATSNGAAPASAMKRGASVDGAMMMASLNADAPVPIQVLSPKAAPVSAPSSPVPAANDYDDVNSDEEAEDHVDLSDQEEDSILREVEEKNFALARQLDEAHSVVERARMSIMLSGDEDASDIVGLSEEQISLFKKLTSQADERMSTVDRLHPEDDSDSDSEGSEMGDEDEEDDGVWI